MYRIGFVLLDGFALMSTSAAMEPLRAANLFSETPLYDIGVLSIAGGAAASSLGARFDARPVAQAGTAFDLVFVVAGGDGDGPLRVRDARLFGWLRRLAHAGVALGGISGGGAVLARAGLMEARRFTVHWHHLDAVRRLSPDLLVERRLYVIDRDRYTCAGGSAPLDMMHAILAARHGAAFARRVSDWFIQTQIRAPDAPQQAGIAARYGVTSRPVEAALDLMESHVGDPLDMAQLAALAGLSARQLQRQFHTALGAPVMEVYRRIRLDTARRLVTGSRLRMAEIAEMTGFASQAAFAERYRRQFGEPPTATRRQA
ncbi:transcriptional regulator, AraC family with amidase-like domain [Rhodovulum sp. ES.010]|uniref:GlxA family transcriptional regulator n=1 Tax=Rhodovulum sp. ES.010 TaxID=1882821 RepID=UPI00092C2153|nr:GlxA family transcriptional regulator [Rhodovulum sp. ES.010]SIO30325.1 transcriptional regulator, AraC family with amidase-like domain [Rhodovulum sp. ES.010]